MTVVNKHTAELKPYDKTQIVSAIRGINMDLGQKNK